MDGGGRDIEKILFQIFVHIGVYILPISDFLKTQISTLSRKFETFFTTTRGRLEVDQRPF